VASLLVEPYDQIEDFLSLEHLRDRAALQGRFQRLGHVGRCQPVSRGFAAANRDANLWDVDLRFDLEINDALHGRHHLGDILAAVAQLLDVAAVEFHCDLRPDAGHHVIQPVRDGLAKIDFHAGHLGDDVADFG
jgi:hypothetical protein